LLGEEVGGVEENGDKKMGVWRKRVTKMGIGMGRKMGVGM
jgi:hypothetical protein